MPKINLFEPKVIVSGLYYEVITPNKLGFTKRSTETNRDEQERNDQRRRARFKRSVNANARAWYWKNYIPHHPIFAVMTFKNQDITPDRAKKEVALCVKRINYDVYNTKNGVLKYHYGLEQHRSGTPHVNMIMYNLPFIPNFQIWFHDIWANGRISISKTKGVEDVGSYVSKYFSKDFHKTKIGRKKRMYTPSKNLIKPQVYTGQQARTIMDVLRTEKPMFNFRTRYIVYEKYCPKGQNLLSAKNTISNLVTAEPPHL